MNLYLHIKPNFNCIMDYNFNKIIMKNGKIYSFILNGLVSVTFYPINTNQSHIAPYTCILSPNMPHIVQTECNNANLVAFPNNNFLLEINPKLSSNFSNNLGLKTKVITSQNTTHTISYFNNNFLNCRIENSNSFLDFSSPNKVTNLKVKTNNEHILLYFECDNFEFFVCHIIYNNNTYKIEKLEKVNLLEEEKNSITTYKNLCDYARHGKVTTYNFSGNFNITKKLVYNNPSPHKTNIKEFIPYAFFEAVKVKNYKLARSYLAEQLNAKLTNQHLKTFFGNFYNTHQSLCKNYNPEEIALFYKTENGNIAKLYSLKINDNNKIENIQEI